MTCDTPVAAFGTAPAASILTLNAGSSTLRFALFSAGNPLRVLLRGKVERIGTDGARWSVSGTNGERMEDRDVTAPDHRAALSLLLTLLDAQPAFAAVNAVAHRLVHGMSHSAPERVTRELLDDLRRIKCVDPEHLPAAIAVIEAVANHRPGLPQVVCFDTAFHRDMPQLARLLPIPRRYQAVGIERYGFHGLSYAFLMEELARLGESSVQRGRLILAHLGNGASLAAVRDGRSIDTSMGFTPAAGMVMSTRSGDLDPGLGFYLEQTQQMTPAQFQHMVNHASGLLGISETSSDMRDLLAREATDERAAQAVALFCYQAKKWLGSFCAALGGLDTLVFCGGIGENAPAIRERICADLEFLGIELDFARNAESAGVISAAASRVTVRVIRTDEELMLARAALPWCARMELPQA